MDKATFWKIMDTSRSHANGDLDRQLELLHRELNKYDPDEIVSFARIFDEYWVRAYTHDLWGAAYIIGGGCSDDGFMDFRGWLISKGEAVYEAAMRNPETLVAVVTEEDGDGQFEGFHYAAWKAWEQKTGNDMDDFPDSGLKSPDEPTGEPWSDEGDDLARRFPKLSRKFD